MIGSAQAAIAASTIYEGVGKSGSPAPNPITGAPAAFSSFAFDVTASVADGAIAPTRLEILDSMPIDSSDYLLIQSCLI